MKHKTAAILIGLSFSWWAFIFIFDLFRENTTCGPTDGFCNSANSVGGDFTWSLVQWTFSTVIITPVVVGAVVNWQIVQKRRKTKK